MDKPAAKDDEIEKETDDYPRLVFEQFFKEIGSDETGLDINISDVIELLKKVDSRCMMICLSQTLPRRTRAQTSQR